MVALYLSFIFFLIASSADVNSGLVNKQVQRSIDLNSQLARHIVEITVENKGSTEESLYLLAVPPSLSSKLSLIQVLDKDDNNLTLTRLSDSTQTLFSVPLHLAPSASVSIKVKLDFIHTMTPFPEETGQAEQHLVKYVGDHHYFYTPYRTTTMRTKVKLPSSNVLSQSELSPFTVKNDVLTYGPYKDVAPKSLSPMTIHFGNANPFLTVKHVQRWIEVSHWGNVAVEEVYHLTHGGAKLKGGFSRYDYQINPMTNGLNSIPVLRQSLPEVATDVYYRDDIGNISTSFLRPGNPQQLDFRPRFPIFGGWKTIFTLGYNLPTNQYLSTSYDDSSLYVLNITYMADWDIPVAVDEQVIKVVLPEGASDINVFVPFEAEISFDTHVTYLDLASYGRPVVVIKKNNLINDHKVFFQVTYHFSSRSLLFEPLLLGGFFFLVFAAIMAVGRVDLSIVREVQSEVHHDIVKGSENLKAIFKERYLVLERLDSSLNSYVKTNNGSDWEKEKRNAAATFARLKKEAAKEISLVSKHDPSLASKLQDLETKHESLESSQNSQQDLIVKFKVTKTIKTQEKFNEESDKLVSYEGLKEELEEEVEEILG